MEAGTTVNSTLGGIARLYTKMEGQRNDGDNKRGDGIRQAHMDHTIKISTLHPLHYAVCHCCYPEYSLQ